MTIAQIDDLISENQKDINKIGFFHNFSEKTAT